MKLSELEQQARQKLEEQEALRLKQELEDRIAEEKATEQFRQDVIAWMVKEGDLDATELRATLSVTNRTHKKLKLRVPDHTDITFQLASRGQVALVVRGGQFDVERADGFTRYCKSLGNALLAASEEWQERVRDEAREAEREAARQTKRERQEREAAERGAKYLALLDDHPILRPILDILGTFMEERERFADDLEAAEEFSLGVEARYEESLEQARYEARRADEERSRLQHDLYDAQDKLSEAERKGKRSW